MGKLSSYELLSRVWKECDLNDILDYGLENGYIGSEDIINAASEYSDPNKEYSDDEIKDIVKEGDLHIIIEALNEKYLLDEIINELDTDEILNEIGWDDVYYHFEFEYEDKLEEKYNEGYDDCLIDQKNNQQLCESDIKHPIRDGNINEMWCYLCDEFEISYYDVEGFYKKMTSLIRLLNKSMYKDKNDLQFISINIES